MKRIALVLVLLTTAAASSLFAQTNNIVRGIITYQNSNSQPAANVQITTFGANPVYTNSAGQFEIRFSGGKPGQTVRLIVQKESFLILGPDPMVFETGIRENPDDFVRIALANIQDFQSRVERFLGSIDRRIQEQSKAIQAFDSDQAEKIAQLYKEIEELEKSKSELARQFAAIDLDQASGFAKEALEKFENGDLAGAMALMNKEALDAHYQKVLAQEEKLEKAKAQAIENYILLARMQRADLKFEEAAQTYRDAIDKDPSNVANLMELGKFLSEMNLDNEALSYFSSALALSRDKTQKIDLLNVIGSALTAQNRPAQADSLLQEAYGLSKKSEDPADALKVLASLGALYQTSNDYSRSEQYFLEGLELCEPLFKKHPDLYFSHWTGLNGATFTLYSMAGDIEKASPFAMAAFDAYSQTPGQRSSEQLLSLGLMLNNLGHALINQHEFDDADTLLLLALGLCIDLEERNFKTALPLKSLVFNNLGMSQYNRGQFELAIYFLEEALKINKELEVRNPARFQPMSGLLTGNLAMSYMETGDPEASERYFEESLETYKKLIPLNPAGFLVQYATVQENRLILYQQTKTIADVIEAQDQYLIALQDLNEVFPGQFTENIAFVCGEMAWNMINVGHYRGAIEKSLEGLRIDPMQSWIYTVLAPAHLLAGNFKEARDIYTKWKDQNYYLDATQTFRQVFRQDLEALEQAGIRNNDFDKIRKILAK